MVQDIGVRHADRRADIGHGDGRRPAIEQQPSRRDEGLLAHFVAHALAPPDPRNFRVCHLPLHDQPAKSGLDA